MTRTGWIVAPAMLAELGTGITLLWMRPPMVAGTLVWLGLVALGIVWLSTALLQVPRHNTLARGWEERAGRQLVATNWVRTIAWSCRALLVLAMLTATIE